MLLHIHSKVMKVSSTVQSFRTDTFFFILNIPQKNNSEKMMEVWFLFPAYCLMKLYICLKFHENIEDRCKVIEWIQF